MQRFANVNPIAMTNFRENPNRRTADFAVHVALARSSEEASRLLCRLYGLHNKRQTVVNLKNRLKAVGVQIDVAAVEPLSPQEAVRQWRCVGRLKSV